MAGGVEIRAEVKAILENLPIIGRKKDGSPIYPISGGETDDDLPYKPNALRRIGYSGDEVEKAIRDREQHIKNLRVRDRLRGEEDVSTSAIVGRYGLEDPTDQEIAEASKLT